MDSHYDISCKVVITKGGEQFLLPLIHIVRNEYHRICSCIPCLDEANATKHSLEIEHGQNLLKCKVRKDSISKKWGDTGNRLYSVSYTYVAFEPTPIF